MHMIDFEYADKRLSDFNFIICHINTDGGVSNVSIGSDITFNTIKNTNSSIHKVTSSSYESVYTTTPFEIIKDPCKNKYTQEKMYMNDFEIREIVKWLNRRDYHKFKPLGGVGQYTDVCYYGSFNVEQITLNGETIGLSLTFTSNAPYGFSEEILEYEITKANDMFYVDIDSDEIGTIYPKATITCKQDGNFKIKNNLSGNQMVINNCKNGEVITIDGENKLISSSLSSHSTLFNDFNYTWIDLVSNDEEAINSYTISIPCTIEIKYSSVRKVAVT